MYYYFYKGSKFVRSTNCCVSIDGKVYHEYIREFKKLHNASVYTDGKVWIGTDKEIVDAEFKKYVTKCKKEMFISAVEKYLKRNNYEYEIKECGTGSVYFYFNDISDFVIRVSDHPGFGYPVNFRYDLHSDKYTEAQAKALVERTLRNVMTAKNISRVKRKFMDI